MLRRVNAALFEAPAGAQIQIVAEARDNNGVNEARFEYAQQILTAETILGLPGCTFTVGDDSERLQAGVVFHAGAPASARYDLFEVENGVKNDLQKSVRHSDSAHQISFTIEPVPLEVEAAPRAAARRAPATIPIRKPARKPTATKKKAAKRSAAKKGVAKKKTVRKRKARAASRKRAPSRKRASSRKRGR